MMFSEYGSEDEVSKLLGISKAEVKRAVSGWKKRIK